MKLVPTPATEALQEAERNMRKAAGRANDDEDADSCDRAGTGGSERLGRTTTSETASGMVASEFAGGRERPLELGQQAEPPPVGFSSPPGLDDETFI